MPPAAGYHEERLIYTVGHSDQTIEAFIALLKRFDIDLVVDVRSQPYSRWTPQFNREVLARSLEEKGLVYLFMGDRLGGRPDDVTLMATGTGHPDYKRMAKRAAYREGIAELVDLATQKQVTILCSEGDHRQCHRHHLITQTLLEREDVRVLHIEPDGSTVAGELIPEQLSLFEIGAPDGQC
jgi:uncharacterized protein (DUF488 family)